MKIKKCIVIIISLALVCGIGIWQKDKVIAQSRSTALGEKIVLNSQMKDKDNPAIIVNGIKITKEELSNLRDSYRADDINISEKDIGEPAIRHKILYQEAINRGLIVDINDAQKFTEQQKQAILSDKEDPAVIELLEYIDGLGLSVDEYFEQMIPYYQEGMYIGLLRQQIYDEVEKKSDNLSPNKLHQKQMKAFEQFYNDLREKAVVEMGVSIIPCKWIYK